MANEARMKKWRAHALNLLLFIAVIGGIRLWQQRDMVSGPAPGLQAITLAGIPYQLPVHPEHPVLVHFWATWCPVCRVEQGSIASLAQDNPNVITIAMKSGNDQAVAAHMQEQGIGFPVINDPDGSIARAWGVNAVPVSFIIDTSGEIRFIEVGYTTEIGLRLRSWLAGI